MVTSRLSQFPQGAAYHLFLWPGRFIHQRRRGLLGIGPWSSASCNPSSKEADRKITMVAPCSAKEAIFSRSGTGVRPAIRVMITV